MLRSVREFRWACLLAAADFRLHWGRAIVDILLAATALTLLFVVFSIRTGVVEGYARDVLNSPESLKIGVNPTRATDADIAALASEPETAFAAAGVSFLNRYLPLAENETAAGLRVRVTPIGPGDPYFPVETAPPQEFDAWIGDDLALAAAKKAGDMLTLSYYVRQGEARERIRLTIRGIIESSNAYERAIFVNPRLAAAISVRADTPQGEIVFDGSRPDFGLTASARYVDVRLYARDLESVAGLVRKVNALGWRAESNDALISERLALEDATGLLVGLIAIAVIGMFVVTYGLATWNRLLRLRRPLGLLLVHGATPTGVLWIPLVQSWIISIAGTLLAVGAFFAIRAGVSAQLSAFLEPLGVSGRVMPWQAVYSIYSIIVMLVLGSFATIQAERLSRVKPVFREGENA